VFHFFSDLSVVFPFMVLCSIGSACFQSMIDDR
jgi:hypothetical protein